MKAKLAFTMRHLYDSLRELMLTLPSRISKSTIALVVLFSITFVIRFLAVNAQPAPPSEDLGGDLIVLHSYTEKNPVFPYFRYEAPPLYYFVIVLPLTMLFSPITGLKVIDALVPSILIFPFYFFCKIVVNQRPASIIAASLFAFSEAFNEMMGWGGTLNMFAFTFAIGSLYFLVKLMQRQQRNDALLLATFISLTIGTHHLTALFVGITTILALGVSYLPQLKLKPSTKTYGLTAAFAVILSVPYIPYYVSLSANSVNIGPTYSLPFQDILYTLVYTNARTNLSVLLLIGTSTIGFVSSMMIVQRRPGVVVALAAGFASGLLTLFLNPAIYNRAAYFLPISIFVGVGGCLALLASSVRNGSQVLKLLGMLLLGIILTGLVVADVTRLQSSVSYYQIVDTQTLDALNWISQHTNQNDTLFTNYNGLAAWIAGYSERNVLFPRNPGYVLTAPDYLLTTAANAVQAGNYVLSAQALTVGDFFPSSIENPSVYLNSILGTNRFLFSDDDYNVANFTYASGHRSANLVSAQSKTFAGYSQNGIAYSLGFNYSWAFGHSERTITLAAPNYVRFHFAFNAPQSNATSFTSRLIATSGETLAFIQKSENAGTLSVTLRDREEITISLIATSSTSIGAPITFYQNDSITRLPTLTFVASSQGPDVALDISMQIATINVGPKIIFYNAFDLLKEYKIDYLVLDRNAYSQQVRFLNSRLPISLVYSNSKVVILKLL